MIIEGYLEYLDEEELNSLFKTNFIKKFYIELDDKRSIINLRKRIREVNILCQKILKIYQREGEGGEFFFYKITLNKRGEF